MISGLVAYLTPAYVAAGLLVAFILSQILLRLHYARKVIKAGGVHAPRLSGDFDPITGNSARPLT